MRTIFIVGLAYLLAGCAAQRAEIAHLAQTKMVGLTKEQVLGCMGPPQNKAAEGATEVWSYKSGGETRSTSSTMNLGGALSIETDGATQQRYCIVNVAMANGNVSSVNYSGPNGDAFTAGEQCAYAIQNCVPKTP
jgi:hypothetical protein